MDIITVEKRNEKTKAKQLRRSGIVPCCVYGGALQESLSIQIDQNTANKLFRVKREGSKIKLKLDDQLIPAQIKDKTRDFESNAIQHISFQALKADQKVNSVAHVIVLNADKIEGVAEKMLLEIPYSSLPGDMIDTVSIDLDNLPVGTLITVGDIKEFASDKIELQVDAESIVVRINDKKRLSSQPEEVVEEPAE